MKRLATRIWFINSASTSQKSASPVPASLQFAASKANLDDLRTHLTIQTIGHDKLNQLRHVRYFKDIHGIETHMRKHAEILRPKFEAVLEILDRELGGLEIGTWTKPHGGYFISFECSGRLCKGDRCKSKGSRSCHDRCRGNLPL